MEIRVLSDKLSRHPMLSGVPFETVIDYTVDFLRIIDVPAVYSEKTALLDIHDNRAALPCDYVEMIQARPILDNGKPALHKAYRYSTDSFMMSDKGKDPRLPIDHADPYYKIQGNVFYSSKKEGQVEISYRAIETDGEGFPVLPDNPKFTRALESYIKKEWFTILFDLGKINQNQLVQALQDYAFNVGACENEFHSLSLDQAQTLLNSWVTLVPRTMSHAQGFRHDGAPELIINH